MMMKLRFKNFPVHRFSLLLCALSLLWFTSCTEIKEPSFNGMKNWSVGKVSGGFIEVQTTAVLNNPNKVGVTLYDVFVEIYLDKEKLGVIHQVEPVKIRKESDFEIPLKLVVKLENKWMTIADQFMKFLSNKGAILKYKGTVEIRKFGIPVKVNMEDKYELKAKDLKLFKND